MRGAPEMGADLDEEIPMLTGADQESWGKWPAIPPAKDFAERADFAPHERGIRPKELAKHFSFALPRTTPASK